MRWSCAPRRGARPGSKAGTQTFASASEAPSGSSEAFAFDGALLARYVGATVVEFAVLLALLKGFDLALAYMPSHGVVGMYVKPAVAWVGFALLAVKSRAISLLDAARPDKANPTTEKRVMAERKRPSWQPPGYVFAIVWSSIGLLRATACLLAFQTSGSAVCAPLIAMAAHVSIGDTWNAMNNQDNQLGFSVVWVWLGVHLSAWNCVRVFLETSQTAGFLLVPMAVWLSIAPVLVTNIWFINTDEDGRKMPLFPVKLN